jgi:hypothetical protein
MAVSPGYDPLLDNDTVSLNVPQPLYSVDTELNLMAMLEFVMRHESENLTKEAEIRIARWFSDRYGAK